MSNFLNAIRHLISTGDVRISEHGYDELAEDELTVREVLDGIDKAQIVEEYPDYPKEDVYYFCKKLNIPIPFMYYGRFPKDMTNQLC